MIKIRLLLVLLLSISVAACDSLPSFDDVVPDTRDEYRRSRDMPPLEVPPDLTNTTSDTMAIPGEQEAVTLSEFQRQRAQTSGSTVLGKGEFAGEQWLALQASPESVWPELLRFWETEGFTVELADQELGVMETAWQVRSQSQNALRERFRIFTEVGEEGETMLYLSSEQQLVTEGEWFDTQPDAEREKEIIRALNLYFYGKEPEETSVATSSKQPSSTTASRQRAELMAVDSERSILVFPTTFNSAYNSTQTVLERAGIQIMGMNAEAGTYDIMYYAPKPEKKEGLLDKLKFWGDDDEGTPYQLSLTGVGDKTELIINDENGDWATTAEAKDVLDMLLRYYNQ